MSEWRVPLADLEIGEAEIAAVVDTYRSGWLTMGPRTQELGELFADYVGSGHAIPVANGTAALHLICCAAGLGPGDEVIVPSLTFVATANAIRYTGATPVFADIVGLESPWISADSAAAAVSHRTQAIMNMTYGGHPSASAELAELASQRGLVLLEDAAHGLGGSLDGRHLGTFGLAGAYSFFSNKNLPVGEGGMVVTDDAGVAERVQRLRSHGMTSLTWDRYRENAPGYDAVEIGFNYRIDEPRAALAMARLERFERDSELRSAAADRYRERLSQLNGVMLTTQPASGGVHANHLFTVVLDAGFDREEIRSSLTGDGVQTSIHYPPVHTLSAYAEEVDLPLTEEYARRSITLPLFAGITERQVDLVVDALRSAIGG